MSDHHISLTRDEQSHRDLLTKLLLTDHHRRGSAWSLKAVKALFVLLDQKAAR